MQWCALKSCFPAFQSGSNIWKDFGAGKVQQKVNLERGLAKKNHGWSRDGQWIKCVSGKGITGKTMKLLAYKRGQTFFWILAANIFVEEVRAQTFGTVELPESIAEKGTIAVDVMKTDPRTGIPLKPPFGFPTSPAVDGQGTLYFSDGLARNVWKIPMGGAPSLVFHTRVSGLDFDDQGRLISAQDEMVVRHNIGRPNDTLIKSNGESFRDLSIASNGAMFIRSDWGVFFYHPDNSNGQALNYGIKSPNPRPMGIEWAEEQGIVYASFSDGKLRKILLDAEEKRPDLGNALATAVEFAVDSARIIFSHQGLALDELGNVYSTTDYDGVKVFDKDGRLQGKINIGATGLAFGENRTLFLTANDGVYKVQLKVSGRRRPNSSGIFIRSQSKNHRLFMRSTIKTWNETFGYTLLGQRLGVSPSNSRILIENSGLSRQTK